MKKTQKKEDDPKLNWKQNVVLYLHDLLHMMLFMIAVFLVAFRIIVVSGPSMYDTLLNGDYILLLSNVFYHDPQYGDIVVASKESFDDGKPIIKRVIATEGQMVDIDFAQGVVYVDGVALQEDYTYTPTNVEEGMQFPLIVDNGCVFLMGDNRNGSQDSRSTQIGLVDKRELLGKALFLMLPGTDPGALSPDYSRVGGIA